jgi:hypothetical protein
MTMRRHLEDELLLDVLEGTASSEAARHVAECPQCSGRVAEARAGLSLAVAAEAPDPSPLYWDVFRRRVARAIEVERRPARGLGRYMGPALLATAAMVGLVSFVPYHPASLDLPPAPMTASSALPSIDDGNVDAAAASVEDFGCSDVAACVAGLTDEESRALADELRAELAGSGDL